MWSLIVVACSILGPSLALPEVSYPFNSQFPTVARVDNPYDFQLAPSSFAPVGDGVKYALSGAPVWLSIDSTTRRLQGTPKVNDVGVSMFRISATDSSGTASMDAMLFTVMDPPPGLGEDVSSQLAKTEKLSGPRTVPIRSGAQFDIKFSRNTFADDGSRKRYYATSKDRTPLPTWLKFTPETLGFTGRTPDTTGPPQEFMIILIASEIDGFEAASVNFTIAVSPHELVFDPWENNLRLRGESGSTRNIKNTLFLDGKVAVNSDISRLSVETPDWIKFDDGVFRAAGGIPSSIQETTINVLAEDRFGNRASCVVRVKVDKDKLGLFRNDIGPIDATIGEEFRYTFAQSLFTRPDVSVEIVLGSASSWLQFDPRTLTLHGKVPTGLEPSKIPVKLIASSSSNFEDEEKFHISLKPVTSKVLPTPSSTSKTDMAPLSAIPSSTSTAGSGPVLASASKEKATRKITVIVVVVCVLLFLILVTGACFLYRYKRFRFWRKSGRSVLKADISKPSLVQEEWEQDGPAEFQDAEKGTTGRTPKLERPPRVQLNLSPVRSTNRFSRSSLRAMIAGDSPTKNTVAGQKAIRRLSTDHCSLTEAEADMMACQAWDPASRSAGDDLDDSMSIPTAMARRSQRISGVHSNRTSKHFSKPVPVNRCVVGLGHGRGANIYGPSSGVSNLNVNEIDPNRPTPRRGSRGRDCSTGSYSTHSTGLVPSVSPSQFPSPPTFQRPPVNPFISPCYEIPAPNIITDVCTTSEPHQQPSTARTGSLKKGPGLTRQSTSTTFFTKHRSYIPTRRSVHGSTFFHTRSCTPSETRVGSGRGSLSRRWTAYVGKTEDGDLESLSLEPLPRCYLPRERSSLRSSVLFGDAREGSESEWSDDSSISLLSDTSHSDTTGEDNADTVIDADADADIIAEEERSTTPADLTVPPLTIRSPARNCNDQNPNACDASPSPPIPIDPRVAPGQENPISINDIDLPSPLRSHLHMKHAASDLHSHRRHSRALAERSTNTCVRAGGPSSRRPSSIARMAELGEDQGEPSSAVQDRSFLAVPRRRMAGRVRVLDEEDEEGATAQVGSSGVSERWMRAMGLGEGAIMSRGRESYRLWKEEGMVRERVERLESGEKWAPLDAGGEGCGWEMDEGLGVMMMEDRERGRREKTMSGDWETVREASEGMVFF